MKEKSFKSRITELEDKIKQQEEEIEKLKKKDKRKSFWLFWLLWRKDREKGGQKMAKHTKILKDGDEYIVLYAEETKAKEFSNKDEAEEFAEEVEKDF